MLRTKRPILMLRGPLKGRVLDDLPWQQAENEVDNCFARWADVEQPNAPPVPTEPRPGAQTPPPAASRARSATETAAISTRRRRR